jgi:hypothetical protein
MYNNRKPVLISLYRREALKPTEHKDHSMKTSLKPIKHVSVALITFIAIFGATIVPFLK